MPPHFRKPTPPHRLAWQDFREEESRGLQPRSEFIKVGKPNAVFIKQLPRREEIQKRREALLQVLEEVNKELAELEKGDGGKR